MIAVKEPGMNPQDSAAVVEVDQMTILGLAQGEDFAAINGSSKTRFQRPDMQSWIQVRTQRVGYLHTVLKCLD